MNRLFLSMIVSVFLSVCGAAPVAASSPAAEDTPPLRQLLVEVVHGEQSRDSSTTQRTFSFSDGQIVFTQRRHPQRHSQPVSIAFPADKQDILLLQDILAMAGLPAVPPHVDQTRPVPGTYLTISVTYEGMDETWSWASEGPTGWGSDRDTAFRRSAAYDKGQDLISRLEALARDHGPGE